MTACHSFYGYCVVESFYERLIICFTLVPVLLRKKFILSFLWKEAFPIEFLIEPKFVIRRFFFFRGKKVGFIDKEFIKSLLEIA